MDMGKNDLPKSNKAGSCGRKTSVVSGMELVEMHANRGRYGLSALVWMSQGESLPQKVRVAAGLKAVEKYCAFGLVGILRIMSKDASLPKKVRMKACESIDEAASNAVEISAGFLRTGFDSKTPESKNLPQEAEGAAKEKLQPSAKDSLFFRAAQNPIALDGIRLDSSSVARELARKARQEWAAKREGQKRKI
jgi:hypothetical protein